MISEKQKHVKVVRIKLDTGERIACLINAQTGIPFRMVTRWVMCYRRLRVQSSTLYKNLHAVGELYSWCQQNKINLDKLLISGQRLPSHQIRAFSNYLRTRITPRKGHTPSLATVNGYWHGISDFLLWCWDNRTQYQIQEGLTLSDIQEHRYTLTMMLRSQIFYGKVSHRIQPLSIENVEAIRSVLVPSNQNGTWIFPEGIFTNTNQLRNWLMIEIALNLGLRVGEILKLRLDSFGRGSRQLLLVKRNPDDIHDTRSAEPSVKTAERGLPLPQYLSSLIRSYVTMRPPLGRVSGKTPYLFTSESGKPLSIARTNDIVKHIGIKSDVKPLSWHRFRHTWAEATAKILLDEPNGIDQLMYLGGWTSTNSLQVYMQNAVAEQAQRHLKHWQNTLYFEEEMS